MLVVVYRIFGTAFAPIFKGQAVKKESRATCGYCYIGHGVCCDGSQWGKGSSQITRAWSCYQALGGRGWVQ